MSLLSEGKRDTVYLFEASVVGTPRPDGGEVLEVRFFDLDELPTTVSPATLRRLAELRKERGTRWLVVDFITAAPFSWAGHLLGSKSSRSCPPSTRFPPWARSGNLIATPEPGRRSNPTGRLGCRTRLGRKWDHFVAFFEHCAQRGRNIRLTKGLSQSGKSSAAFVVPVYPVISSTGSSGKVRSIRCERAWPSIPGIM